jgi:tRNA/rRNA methyltransferase
MDLCFILCKPGIPENVGAAARALVTMGFKQLRLVQHPVRPCNPLDLRARSMACGAVGVLENTRVFSSLKEALADVDLIIGTTARVRRGRNRYYTPMQLRVLLENKQESIHRAALLFGAETAGLSTAELSRCNLVSSIPSNESQPSLNLAQAVMVYAYELSTASHGAGRQRTQNKIIPTSQPVFQKKVEELFELLEIGRDKRIYDRILERISVFSDEDIRMAHFVRKKVLAKIKGRIRGQ